MRLVGGSGQRFISPSYSAEKMPEIKRLGLEFSSKRV